MPTWPKATRQRFAVCRADRPGSCGAKAGLACSGRSSGWATGRLRFDDSSCLSGWIGVARRRHSASSTAKASAATPRGARPTATSRCSMRWGSFPTRGQAAEASAGPAGWPTAADGNWSRWAKAAAARPVRPARRHRRGVRPIRRVRPVATRAVPPAAVPIAAPRAARAARSPFKKPTCAAKTTSSTSTSERSPSR